MITQSRLMKAVDAVIDRIVNDYPIEADEGGDEASSEDEITWSPVTGHYLILSISGQNTGTKANVYEFMMIDGEIFNLFVTETNRYALQERQKYRKPKARINQWKETYQQEMEKFVAKIQNTRERRKAACRDEARFEDKQTVLQEKANNIEEEYSVLQKVHLNIQKNQQLAISGLEEQAIRMKMHSDYKFPLIEKGTTVTIPVPDVDRSKGDLRNLIGIVMEVTPDSFYKIGTKTGALSNLYSRS
ncbi:hypothetical protein QE152_g19084 [Popillia japonica]|uniref:Uncharacterized protein n=1 Tax=Popillia japonica TaxID=7064 RepID=A0AAW1L3E3_POPJA